MNGIAATDMVLWVVVLVYWAAVLMLVRTRRRRLPVAVLILPAFFLLLGTIMNRYWAPVGTYAVVFVHLILLHPLWRIANANQQ